MPHLRGTLQRLWLNVGRKPDSLTPIRPGCIILLMRAIYISTAAIILTFCPVASGLALNDYSIWLRAHPQAIVADSYSSTTITAEVRDPMGRAVADGTMVEFTTSMGIIERTAQTSGGIARARLQSGSTTGTALISAIVTNGNAVGQLRVDFLERGTEMFDESFISVSSPKHLGYDVGAGLVDSAGGVKIYHRGVTIDAEEAQINARTNILRAKARLGGDNIAITRGTKKLTASALYYDFNSMSGVILTPAEDGAKRMLFRGRDLFIQEDTDPKKEATFDFQPVSEANMFIKARSIIIRPGEEIKIKRANFYMEGDKVLSVPLHVVPLRTQSSTGLNQMVTYGTEGLRLDLPIYYSLTPTGTGSVRLRRSEPTQWGYYSGRSGWQTDIEQDYNIGGSTDGAFSLNRITSGDWGARWNHRREFNDNSHVYTYLDFPSHRDLYSTIDYSRPLGDYTFSMNFRGSKIRNMDGRYSTSAYIQSRSKPLVGDAVSYAFSTRLSYDNPVLGRPGGVGSGLGLQLYGKPLQFGRTSSLNTSLNVSHDIGGTYPGTNIFANAGYYKMLGNIGQLGLNYSYSWANSAYAFNSQRLSANLSLQPSMEWATHLYLTRGLGDGSTSAFGDFSYMFMPTWRISLLGTYQSFKSVGDFTYTDAEFALSKSVGRQEARIIWSQSRKKFRVEFNALSF